MLCLFCKLTVFSNDIPFWSCPEHYLRLPTLETYLDWDFDGMSLHIHSRTHLGLYLVPGTKQHMVQRMCYNQFLTNAVAISTSSAHILRAAKNLLPISSSTLVLKWGVVSSCFEVGENDCNINQHNPGLKSVVCLKGVLFRERAAQHAKLHVTHWRRFKCFHSSPVCIPSVIDAMMMSLWPNLWTAICTS